MAELLAIANDMRCPKCDRRLPNATGKIRCSCGSVSYGDGTQQPAVRVERPERPPCKHLGESLGEIDCGCAGKRYAYKCDIFAMCLKTPLSKPGFDLAGKWIPITDVGMCSICPIHSPSSGNQKVTAQTNELPFGYLSDEIDQGKTSYSENTLTS